MADRANRDSLSQRYHRTPDLPTLTDTGNGWKWVEMKVR
jgi:hypothetical protein